ncbi:MAG: three-Cys-motif partner protein TcmP [Nannocystis sp.]|nr:three-Cys-motif partner protein TcmP [Nannocystis sp.]
MVQKDDYEGREQAYVKHYVLKHYLEQLALKIGHFRPGTTLNYIDGFSGPWQHATEDLRDTSPHVALTQLLKAKDELANANKELHVRGFFVERDPEAFSRLQSLLSSFKTATTEPYEGRFEDHLEEARRFAERGPNAFAFIFIDPTGWTGYPLGQITPLLQVKPCEVMINFMTKDIVRFVDDESSTARDSFIALFGDDTHREEWRALTGDAREDKIVEAYCARLGVAGGFNHVGATIVLHPQQDRTHYHLVYATRSLHGLIAFRDSERKAFGAQHEVRAGARQRSRIDRNHQTELFTAPVMETPYMDLLRERYQSRARAAVEATLEEARGEVPFDDIIGVALAFPLTSLSDLKSWLEDLKKQGRVTFVGQGAKERALKEGSKHRLSWRR